MNSSYDEAWMDLVYTHVPKLIGRPNYVHGEEGFMLKLEYRHAPFYIPVDFIDTSNVDFILVNIEDKQLLILRRVSENNYIAVDDPSLTITKALITTYVNNTIKDYLWDICTKCRVLNTSIAAYNCHEDNGNYVFHYTLDFLDKCMPEVIDILLPQVPSCMGLMSSGGNVINMDISTAVNDNTVEFIFKDKLQAILPTNQPVALVNSKLKRLFLQNEENKMNSNPDNKIKLCHIVAVDKNNGIGHKNHLLFKISEDLKHFKKLTTGSVVIMGRKTYESIGKPLPNRDNIVITNDPTYMVEGVLVVNSINIAITKAMDIANKKSLEEVFIIGGEMVYNQTMDVVDRVYLTYVDIDAGLDNIDAFYPSLSNGFTLIGCAPKKVDDNTDVTYAFHTYARTII